MYFFADIQNEARNNCHIADGHGWILSGCYTSDLKGLIETWVSAEDPVSPDFIYEM